MELAVELELDNWQFSLLRAEVRSGSGLRRVGSCLTKLLTKTKTKLHFYQLVSAMDYLHSKKICHGNLKPENILCWWNETGCQDQRHGSQQTFWISAQFSRPFVGSHSTLPKRSCMVSGPVCFADLSLTASRVLLGPLCCHLHPTSYDTYDCCQAPTQLSTPSPQQVNSTHPRV